MKVLVTSGDTRHQSLEESASEGFEDLAHRIPDTSKLTNITGWKSKKDLSTILEETHQVLNKS